MKAFIEEIKKKSAENLYNELDSSSNGLTSEEAKKRLETFGSNEIIEKKSNPFLKFLKSFWGPIPWMIEIAAILSAVIKRWEDFWIILTLLILNAVVSFWQENKADNAIEMLKKKLALNARVFRDKNWKQIKANLLVPGDIIRVRLGEVVPADIKLISGDYLQIDESALTGESLPIEKKIDDAAYSGSVVKQGEMNGLVAATGMNTYFGRTAKLVEEATTQSHFQKAVIKIGNYLIFFALALVLLIILVGFFRHEGFMEMFQFALVLMVAAIPAALPAVLSVTMAVGATALAKKEAIVSKLASIEEMAGMDILCSDKTGTITKNELTVANVIPYDTFNDNDVLLYAALASNADDQDAIDNAILEKSNKIADIKNSLSDYSLDNFKPFDPVKKRTEASVHDKNNNRFKVSKGAPQVILSLVGDGDVSLESKVNKDVLDFANNGYRALGVAKAGSDDKWHFAGLIPLYDPPREDSLETIKQAQKMGVEVKMITGDHTAIAKQIAKETGLGQKIEPAEKLLALDDRKALRLIENSNGFAQVFPEHKYEIVELLQAKGHIVGMTGDGVNDAPALKKADAGIAVAGATDAAKSAAAIVLTKPGLSVIIDAIEQSRRIFQRMGNYSIYRIAETIRVLLFISLSIITFQFYPVTALMIVLLALLNDAPIMTIAFDNVKVSATPDRWNMRTTLGISTVLGIIGVFSSFGIFFIGKEVFHIGNEALQSFIYLKLSVAGHLTVFVARTKGHFWSVKPSKSLLFAVITTQIVATLIVIFGFLLPALSWKLALFVWGYALIAFIITDFLKVQAYKMFDHSKIKFGNK
ncbi:MAG: plasma-membrane proton-efflux P-type ATPase [Bacteroidales bacterium]|nr:plasma-membrane proton-efflux P-type ATPase [Bacteroidales bacterium]